MASVSYYIRKNTGNKPVAIYCRFSHGKEVDLRHRTEQVVIPLHWNETEQRVCRFSNVDYKDAVNAHLEKMKSHIYSIYAKSDVIEKLFLKNAILSYYNPNIISGKPITLLSYSEHYIRRKENEDIAQGTLQNIQQFHNLLKEYIPNDINLKDIDEAFCEGYINHQTQMGYSHNTIALRTTMLKSTINSAINEGLELPKYNPRYLKHTTEESEHVYLNATELKMIEGVKLEGTKDRVRDLFLVGAWTGLRYSDWGKINGGLKGDFLTVKTKKTGETVIIPIHPTIHRILKKYPDGLPKVPSKPYFNILIREVCKDANINETIEKTTTKGGENIKEVYLKHELIGTLTARRSFATNAFHAGIPTRAIMELTGHKTEHSFLIYIKATPHEYAQKILDVWKNM